jgi:uncharacterized membrane protein (DUF373 family)
LVSDSTSRVERLLGLLADYLVILFAALMLAGLVVALFKVATDLIPIVQAQSFDTGSRDFVIDTLSAFVVLELLLGFIQYHGATRIQPTYILDAGLFFVTRQLMITLYTGAISAVDLVAFGAIIGAIGLTRTMLSRLPKEEKINTRADSDSRGVQTSS